MNTELNAGPVHVQRNGEVTVSLSNPVQSNLDQTQDPINPQRHNSARHRTLKQPGLVD